MKLGTAAAPKPKAAALAKASDNAAGQSGADPAVAECPLHNTVVRLNVVLWHLKELGGGFYMPTKRPDYAVDAIAAVLAAVKADVCIVTGIERTDGASVVATDGAAAFEAAVEDTGVAEMDRILAALKTADAAGSWAMAIPKNDDGKTLYEGDRTSAVLYKTSGGRTRTALDVIGGSASADLGVGQFLIDCALVFPSTEGGPSVRVDVMTPIGGADSKSAIPTTAEKPASFLLALSALGDVVANQSRLNAVRSAVGAESRPLLAEGNVLARDFWDSVWDTSDMMLENYELVNPADVRLQDGAMHWEALETPDHPDALEDVSGALYDAVFVCNGDAKPRYRVQGLRAVDLMRASLTADELTKAGADSPLDEDAKIAEKRSLHRTAAGYLATWSVEDDPANALAECADFTRMISDHWPLLAVVDVHS